MRIELKPNEPPANDSNDARYWDARDLETEARRVFEVCHSCRMCVTYCGAFPNLFQRVDRDIETRGAEGAELLDAQDFSSVTELCWQCKLCYIKCPYTPDEEHEWALDFPRLLMREKAQRARRNGVTFQDQVLGEPQLLGALGAGRHAPLSNLVHASKLVRKLMEKTIGISAEFPLPPFTSEPFEAWFEKHVPLENAGKEGTVAIFDTCLVDHHFPSVGRAAVMVLEKNGYRIERPAQTCCGLPNLDGGDLEGAKAKARLNVAALLPYAERGEPIVVSGPSCSYMLKKEVPELLGTPEARLVASHVVDLMQLLDQRRRKKTLATDFTSPLGRIAYHAACHLRAQKIGAPGARVLGLIPDTEVRIIEECSAVDGTWGMKSQFYELGRRYAQRLVNGVSGADAGWVVTDCQLSARRISQENAVGVLHPVEVLAHAYGLVDETSRAATKAP